MVISLSEREAGWSADGTWALSMPVRSSAPRWWFGSYGLIPPSGSTFACYLIRDWEHSLSPAWERDCLYGALRTAGLWPLCGVASSGTGSGLEASSPTSSSAELDSILRMLEGSPKILLLGDSLTAHHYAVPR